MEELVHLLVLVRNEHNETVNAESPACCGRKSPFQSRKKSPKVRKVSYNESKDIKSYHTRQLAELRHRPSLCP
jgi:hypothetical protein